MAVLLVASLVANAWLVSTRGLEPLGIDRGAGEVQTERDAVMSQSRQFMLRMGTYGPDQLQDGQLTEYRDLVTEVITPKFATSFEQSVTAAEQIVAKGGVAREAEVFATGVATLGDDRATALVAGAFTDSYPNRKGKLQPQEPVPFRMELTLVRTDGRWLVDDFNPVTGAAE
jgi:Mce-associated membrane protein